MTTRSQELLERPYCANHLGRGPTLKYLSVADGVLIHACRRCGHGGQVITAKAWRAMRRRPTKT